MPHVHTEAGTINDLLCANCSLRQHLTWVATEYEDLAISIEVLQDDGLELLIAIPDKNSVGARLPLSWKGRCVQGEDSGSTTLNDPGS